MNNNDEKCENSNLKGKKCDICGGNNKKNITTTVNYAYKYL